MKRINKSITAHQNYHTYTWWLSCLEELLLSLWVGDGDVISLRLDRFLATVLSFLWKLQRRVSQQSHEEHHSELWRPRHNSPHCGEGFKRADVRAAQRLHNRCMQDQTKRSLLLTVWLSKCKQPNLGYEDWLHSKKIARHTKELKRVYSPQVSVSPAGPAHIFKSLSLTQRYFFPYICKYISIPNVYESNSQTERFTVDQTSGGL